MRRRSRAESIAALFRPPRTESTAEGAAALTARDRFVSAQALISAFYAVLFFLAAGNLYHWQSSLEATTLTPRWPVFWLRYVDTRAGVWFILWCHLLGGVLAVTLVRYRVARVLIFLSLLQFLAFRFSFGSINHGDHLGLLLSFVLIFLPAGWRSYPGADRTVTAGTLLVFSGCQAMILLTYSMSGLWKVVGVVRQVLQGEVHYLLPEGLARQIAAKLLSADTTSVLGPWLIEHYWVGWPLGVAAIYLELFALWVVFRPSLHQIWGVGLIFFHLATHLTMGIGFVQNGLWLALFLVLSPFRPREPRWRRALRDLPLLGRGVGAPAPPA